MDERGVSERSLRLGPQQNVLAEAYGIRRCETSYCAILEWDCGIPVFCIPARGRAKFQKKNGLWSRHHKRSVAEGTSPLGSRSRVLSRRMTR